MDDLSTSLNNSGIGGHTGEKTINHLCYTDERSAIIIINLLFQTIVHMDIKKIYKTHIINKLKIIRINGNQ